jgi:hypothetical protein
MIQKVLSGIAVTVFALSAAIGFGEGINRGSVQPINVSVTSESVDGRTVICVVKDPSVKEFDSATFARLKGVTFKNGTIKARVMSRLAKDAPDFARGFIGIAFRVTDDNSSFECIYVRPGNARVDDQVRRNHSIQYFAYPDFKFQRLRKESPEKYESYADMGLNEWIDLKIVVKGAEAKLYVNGAAQPAIVVTDLKLGDAADGGVGLFVDVGTEGLFSDVIVETN